MGGCHQAPDYLWIGCADSRGPANEIIDPPAGEVFFHRNIANGDMHTDLNCLSMIQHAVEALNAGQIIACGHYGRGGMEATLEERDRGLIDNGLRHIKRISSGVESGRMTAGAPDR